MKGYQKRIIQNKDSTKKKIIIGNKKDLENMREVSEEYLQEFCKEHQITGFEVSAKNGDNVKEAFEALVQMIVEGKTEEELINPYIKRGTQRGVRIKKFKKKRTNVVIAKIGYS